jgi:hypothetical protein
MYEMEMTQELNQKLAKIAYNAYGDFREWTAYDKSPMPKWDNLTLSIIDAWMIAANAVVAEYEKACVK